MPVFIFCYVSLENKTARNTVSPNREITEVPIKLLHIDKTFFSSTAAKDTQFTFSRKKKDRCVKVIRILKYQSWPCFSFQLKLHHTSLSSVEVSLCYQQEARERQKEHRGRWVFFLFPWSSASLLFFSNRPFPSCTKPPFQSEVKCKAIYMKMTFILLQVKLIFTRKQESF